MTITSRRTLLLILLSTLMSACASNDIYRSQFSTCTVAAEQSCESHSIQLHNVATKKEFLLGIVEIDDQGQLRNRMQMDELISKLETTAAKESLLINVFVHGWHHNAKPGDPNIDSFKENLAQLSEIENALHKQPRKVVGVYIGWRGESIDLPFLNDLTFWDRKNTAQKVGQFGMAEILLRLEQIRNVKNTQRPQLKSRLVIVGHSFGGAAVYHATAQILADRFIDSRNDKNFIDTAKGFGDLVVLLNPAFEALSYAPLYDLAQSRCSYFDNQQPRLVVLTSEADDATKYLFPLGRSLSTLFETYGTIERNECKRPLNYSEGVADRNTVGHFEPLLTHELRPASVVQAAAYNKVRNIWSQQQVGGTMQFGSTELVSLDRTAVRNPYLNVKVDASLMANHNDVFRKEIMEFVRMLTVLSSNDE
jgi:hypothetical protein